MGMIDQPIQHYSILPKNTSNLDKIITPRSWGGYALPFSNEKTPGRYFPATNQIWILGDISREEREIVLIHEQLHAFTTCFQPAQLYELRTELTGIMGLPNGKCFNDIVEVVCMTYFLVYTGLEITSRYLVGGTIQQVELAAKLIKLAELTARNVSRNLTVKQAVREALAGLCTLLMHVVPYRPKLAPTIFNVVESIPFPHNWNNQWQVFHHYYAELHKKWTSSQDLANQFVLTLPFDLHRDILDMVIFFANAILAAPVRPEAVTAVFPTLLMILTLRNFRFAPILNILSRGSQNKVRIHVGHVTRKSLKHMKHAMSIQHKNLIQSQKSGKSCQAARIFLAIAEKVSPFISINQPDRAFLCFKSMLELIPMLLKKWARGANICSECAYISKMPVFEAALADIVNMSSETRKRLLKAVKMYENWLQTDALKIIRDRYSLPEFTKVVQVYHFL